MKNLKDILHGINVLQQFGTPPQGIENICFDSRKVSQGDLFVAVGGTQVDGHQFIEGCIAQGATVIVCENLPQNIQPKITYLQVANSAHALGILASNFYGDPSSLLKVVGITGTNGKTSTVTMLFNLYRSLGYKVGLLSTVTNRINNTEIKATHTTPDPLQLQSLLANMVEAGCEFAFMEVSSHSVVQQRIAGIQFAGGLFTNITHDHLDFHKTFKEYIKAKKGFFDALPKEAFAITNLDDKNGLVMLQNTAARKKSFALKTMADYKARLIENSFQGLHLYINEHEIWLPLVGSFNAYNVLGVYAVAIELGADAMEVLQILSNIKTAEGRFELIAGNDEINAIVDYAHTPDALLNVLNTINDIRGGAGKLITVVGAGGDRDKTKRPEMARIASELSDVLILTSDNPRSEDPESILDDMEVGVPIDRKKKMLRITNRTEAIKTASVMAQSGDILLIAGKGHEKYQDIKGIKHPFDDKQTVEQLIKNL